MKTVSNSSNSSNSCVPSVASERLRVGDQRSGIQRSSALFKLKGGKVQLRVHFKKSQQVAGEGAATPLPSRGGVPFGRGGVCNILIANKILTPPLPLPYKGLLFIHILANGSAAEARRAEKKTMVRTDRPGRGAARPLVACYRRDARTPAKADGNISPEGATECSATPSLTLQFEKSVLTNS